MTTVTVLSTLHQVMKYIDKGGRMKTLITNKHPLKGAENYITDSLLYQDSLELGHPLEELDSGDKTETEPESEVECA